MPADQLVDGARLIAHGHEVGGQTERRRQSGIVYAMKLRGFYAILDVAPDALGDAETLARARGHLLAAGPAACSCAPRTVRSPRRPGRWRGRPGSPRSLPPARAFRFASTIGWMSRWRSGPTSSTWARTICRSRTRCGCAPRPAGPTWWSAFRPTTPPRRAPRPPPAPTTSASGRSSAPRSKHEPRSDVGLETLAEVCRAVPGSGGRDRRHHAREGDRGGRGGRRRRRAHRRGRRRARSVSRRPPDRRRVWLSRSEAPQLVQEDLGSLAMVLSSALASAARGDFG